MCGDCGCDRTSSSTDPPSVGLDQKHSIDLSVSIFAKNDQLAAQNRAYFESKQLLVVNLLSSPGAGKTALLERMQQDWGDRSVASSTRTGVIVGDLATDNDAQRLQRAGLAAVQVTTGTICHLDATMVRQAADQLDLDALDLLVIENVGNLVCPASYDLGERLRVALLSVTEGEDKPLKYPVLFKSVDAILITKIDLAEAAAFDREQAIAILHQVAPQAEFFEVSVRTGQGLEDWYHYLRHHLLGPSRVPPPFISWA